MLRDQLVVGISGSVATNHNPKEEEPEAINRVRSVGKPDTQHLIKCPALSATCHKCNRDGHYGSQCLSKTVAASTPDVEAGSVEETFLGTVT